jgi:oxygen-independent coproporphyrinogen III oxidase
MAGIYIHIPFCKQACHYCNFHFSASQNLLPQMVKAICKEAELRNDYIQEDIATVYFGGGTPSLFGIQDLRFTIESLHAFFGIKADAEITIEANPDDITIEKLSGWKEAGINRLSIGVQSFFDEDLQWMNRVHDSAQAYDNIILSKQAGFENISIDLIYGTPGLTDEHWQQNLQTSFELNVQHLSCYALTVEPNTALQKMIELNKKENIDAEQQGRQFELLMQRAEEAGYQHYEISNFAKPGFRSRHNSSYWHGKPYIGLGPSAHSFNGNTRQWNIANNALYIESINKNIVPYEIEELTGIQKLNEYIMTSLRTCEGLSLQHVTGLSNEIISASVLKDAEKFIYRNLMEQRNGSLILTRNGKLFADGIAAELFRA